MKQSISRRVIRGQVWARIDPSGRRTEFEVESVCATGNAMRVRGRTSGGRLVQALHKQMVNGDPRFELVHERYVKEGPPNDDA